MCMCMCMCMCAPFVMQLSQVMLTQYCLAVYNFVLSNQIQILRLPGWAKSRESQGVPLCKNQDHHGKKGKRIEPEFGSSSETSSKREWGGCCATSFRQSVGFRSRRWRGRPVLPTPTQSVSQARVDEALSSYWNTPRIPQHDDILSNFGANTKASIQKSFKLLKQPSVALAVQSFLSVCFRPLAMSSPTSVTVWTLRMPRIRYFSRRTCLTLILITKVYHGRWRVH